MMTLRKRIFVGASILVAVLLALLLLFLMGSKDPGPDSGDGTGDGDGASLAPLVGVGAGPGNAGNTGQIPPPKINRPVVAPEDNQLVHLSRTFVERFGSLSNQNDNRHIDDVLPLTTPSMQQWLRTQDQETSDKYQGKTTTVIVSRLESRDGVNASVHIEAQELLESDAGKETQYKKGSVTLVKQNGEWKIDGLFWNR